MEARDPRTSVLFACGGSKVGGVQRSLIALLKKLPPDEFAVTLLTDSKHAALRRDVPHHVVIAEVPTPVQKLMRLGTLDLRTLPYLARCPRYVRPLLRHVLAGQHRSRRRLMGELWRVYSSAYAGDRGGHRSYDVAIAFSGFMGVWNQFIAETVAADRKVVWIHGDVRRLAEGGGEELATLSSFDRLVTVSPEAGRILSSAYPDLSDRVRVVHNVIDRPELRKRACEPIEVADTARAVGDMHLVSVGRLDAGKGYADGIEALGLLRTDTVTSLTWDIIGEGPQRRQLEALITKLGLSDKVRLLGQRENPLPYVARADVFFHPSRSEGHSVAIEEARALGKPVLATRYATVRDQVVDGVDGMVVGFAPSEIAEGIRRLFDEPELLPSLTRGARSRPELPDALAAFAGVCFD